MATAAAVMPSESIHTGFWGILCPPMRTYMLVAEFAAAAAAFTCNAHAVVLQQPIELHPMTALLQQME